MKAKLKAIFYRSRLVRSLYYFLTHSPNTYIEQFRFMLGDVSEGTCRRMMYRNLLLYGIDYEEFFMFNRPGLTVTDMWQYISDCGRYHYYCLLNKGEEAVLNNKWETYRRFSEYFGRDAVIIESVQDEQIFRGFLEKHTCFVEKQLSLSCGQGIRFHNLGDLTPDGFTEYSKSFSRK